MKNRFTKLLCVLLSLVMFAAVVPLGAWPVADAVIVNNGDLGTVHWELDDNGLLTLSGSGAITPVQTDNDVYSNWKDYKDLVTAVYVGAGITDIGKYAFDELENVTQITFAPNSQLQSFRCGAFRYTAITALTVPASVQNIDIDALNGCEKLQTITVEEGNPNYSSDEYGVLYNKAKTKILLFPRQNPAEHYAIASTAVTYEEGAFYYCKYLNSLVIPSGFTELNRHCFYRCHIQEIWNLCSTPIAKESGRAAGYLAEQALVVHTSAEEPGAMEKYNDFLFCNTADGWVLAGYTGTQKHITLPAAPVLGGETVTSYTVAAGTFEELNEDGYQDIESLVIPASVTAIGEYAFSHCGYLKSIVFAEDSPVVDIPTALFMHCFNLRSVILPKNLETIGASAFYCCTHLTEISFPKTLKSIGEQAFCFCFMLHKINFAENGADCVVGEYAFTNAYLTDLTLPENIVSIGKQAFCISNFNGDENIRFAIAEVYAMAYKFMPEDYPDTYASVDEYYDAMGEIFSQNYKEHSEQFNVNSGAVIHCYRGSVAEQYALANSVAVEYIDSQIPETTTQPTTEPTTQPTTEPTTEPTTQPQKETPTFFQKVAAFFQRILDFFKNIFR